MQTADKAEVDNQNWLLPTYEFKPSDVKPPAPATRAGPWPSGIKVDLQACKSLGMESRWIKVLEHGIDPMLTTLPPEDRHLPNYSSLDEHGSRAAADTALMALAHAGHTEITKLRPKLTHPVGAVLKPLPVAPPPGYVPSVRYITDCTISGLNDCIRSTEMALPTIRDAVRAGRKGWWAAKFDLKDGFFHIPIHADFVDLFGVQHPLSGVTARYRCLCFGVKCAPFFFQGLTVELRRLLLLHGIGCIVLVYIDDFLLLGPTEAAVQHAMNVFVDIIESKLKFRINHEKTVHPTQVVPWGGVLIDYKNGTLRCTPDKAERVSALIQAFLQSPEPMVSFSLLDTLVGKLAFLAILYVGASSA